MPHQEIYRELAECKDTGEFVAYHKWGDTPDIFLVGVVRDLSDTKATFHNVTPRGLFEETSYAVPLRLIHTLDRGTRYLWRLRTLYELGPSLVETREARKPKDVRAMLEEAAHEGGVVTLWTSAHEKDAYRVFSVCAETATVTSVFDSGPPNGRTIIRLRRILRAQFGLSEADDTRVHRHGLENSCPPA